MSRSKASEQNAIEARCIRWCVLMTARSTSAGAVLLWAVLPQLAVVLLSLSFKSWSVLLSQLQITSNWLTFSSSSTALRRSSHASSRCFASEPGLPHRWAPPEGSNGMSNPKLGQASFSSCSSSKRRCHKASGWTAPQWMEGAASSGFHCVGSPLWAAESPR